MSTKQNEAQRLADELDTGDFDVMTNYQAAAVLRSQVELLKQALCVLERVHHTTDDDRIATADAIRAQLEAK